MLKYFIVILNFLGLLGYKVLFPGGVSISSDLPTKFTPGEDVLVTVTIDKGDLTGFAKFSQKLPEGFTATLVDGSDATYSFKDQTVKFIWVALPAVNKFTFSYRLSVADGTEGNFDVEGTFSYIFDNEKQNAYLSKKTIAVGDVPMAAAEETVNDIVKGMVEEDIQGVKVRRTTSPIPGTVNNFKVELRIDKPGISGFAKVEESIPDGFSASEMESSGGIFSFNNQLVKVIWMAVPENDEFHMTYKLVAGESVSGNQKITGAFSYLEGDVSNKYFVAASTIFIEKDEGDQDATIIIADEGGLFKEKEEPKVIEEPVVEEPVVEEPVIEEVVSIPEPQADIIYRVQVAAGHRPVSNDYFSKKFNLNKDIIIDNHQGWIKYTYGSYDVYKDCRDERNKTWSNHKITDAFVTAYNAGSRITVQEALMITNQKWYN